MPRTFLISRGLRSDVERKLMREQDINRSHVIFIVHANYSYDSMCLRFVYHARVCVCVCVWPY